MRRLLLALVAFSTLLVACDGGQDAGDQPGGTSPSLSFPVREQRIPVRLDVKSDGLVQSVFLGSDDAVPVSGKRWHSQFVVAAEGTDVSLERLPAKIANALELFNFGHGVSLTFEAEGSGRMVCTVSADDAVIAVDTDAGQCSVNPDIAFN